MAGKEDFRVFVGGLSWDTTDRGLENAFRRFGKVLEARVMLDRDTGRPRGFGFVTFADEEGVERAIAELHDRELDGRIVSVNKAHPEIGEGGGYYGYGGGYGNGGGRRGGYSGRGGYGGRGGFSREECFRCGQLGHWARECPSGGAGPGDRYGGGPGYGGRYGDRDDFPRDRYGGSDRYGDGNYKDGRSGGYTDRGSRDRYGSGGPARYEGSYRERSGPYDRPSSGRPTYDDRY